jgi:hypothetical protein
MKFKAYSTVALAFAGLVFLNAGTEHNNAIITNTGIAFLGVSALLFASYFILEWLRDKPPGIDSRTDLEKFKRKAKKITVNLDNAKVKTNTWTEERAISNSTESGYLALFGREDSNIEKVRNTLSTIVIPLIIDGKAMDYTYSTARAPETLSMLLSIQKETTLYVNENQEFYLDLEFLE